MNDKTLKQIQELRAMQSQIIHGPSIFGEIADNLEKLEKDSDRLNTIRGLMGHVCNASDTTVRLFQDDATRSYFVKVGESESYFGSTLNEAIDKAKAEHDWEE